MGCLYLCVSVSCWVYVWGGGVYVCGCLFARISQGLHNPLIFILTAGFTDANNIHVKLKPYCLHTYTTADTWQAIEQNTLAILWYIKPVYMRAFKPSCAPFHIWQKIKQSSVILQWGCSRLLYASVRGLLPWTGNWATSSACLAQSMCVDWVKEYMGSVRWTQSHRTLDATLNLPTV